MVNAICCLPSTRFELKRAELKRQATHGSLSHIHLWPQSQGDDYLQTTNSKLGVFRDVIIEDDYNPLEARDHTIRVPTGARTALARDSVELHG